MYRKNWLPPVALALLALTLPIACTTDASSGTDEPKQQQGRKPRTETFTVDITDYKEPKSPWDDLLSDDKLEDKKTTFDPALVHPTLLDGWRLNLSDAIIRLDVPMLKPDQDPQLLALHPSYAAAVKHARAHFTSFESPLPSVNLIDGLAKQFDDGLYAALDQAYYKGLESAFESHVDLVKRVHSQLPPDSNAAAFLAAGLTLAGQQVVGADSTAARQFMAAFESNPVLSKPIGFYTWNDRLSECFRFLRYFQRPFDASDEIALTISKAITSDAALQRDYERANAFYANLTNPLARGTMLDAGGENAESKQVALFPSSASRESALALKLYPNGLPPDADLMREFVTRIRSGELDLAPSAKSGWYDHQVYALETMLLPERGAESNKLMLTKGYKRRMLEAFQALMTKRRETHVRQLDIPLAAAERPMEDLKVAPPLRIEPALTYYLRTARAYAFVANFLESTVGTAPLSSMHGLTKEGERKKDLLTELHDMRDLFYGFYLVGCQDIGMAPQTKSEEPIDNAHCMALATEWLANDWAAHPDLAADTRVAVPIYYDPNRNVTRLWVTLGVRLARLNTSFVRGPSVKPAEGDGDWKPLDSHQWEWKTFLVPVDEFTEVEVQGPRVLTRDELRAICDKHKTKGEIIKAIQGL